MRSYLNILDDCVRHGERKANRTGIDTFVLPPQHFSHKMSDGFPLLTTKTMAKRSILVELEGFIGGITDKNWYKARKCNIWNQWCNGTTRPDGVSAEQHHDLGPIYGRQWRRFDQEYMGPYGSPATVFSHGVPCDQLASIVQTLKDNPNDRRMVCSAWNPNQIKESALPACHVLWNVQHINGKLHLHWHQRSCDMFLGVPFNIASYAMLLTLLAKESGMEAGTLSSTLMDCHIYENHLPQIKEQLTRNTKDLPWVNIKDWTNIWNWTHKQVVWEGYNPHPAIKAEVAV